MHSIFWFQQESMFLDILNNTMFRKEKVTQNTYNIMIYLASKRIMKHKNCLLIRDIFLKKTFTFTDEQNSLITTYVMDFIILLFA